MSDTIAFENHRFGSVEVKESDLLHFPGLPGFAHARRFVVMDHDRESAFAWLVSVDDPDLALAITDPCLFFPSYRPPVELRHLKALGVEKPEDFALLTIATFCDGRIYLNLMAPLLVNAARGRGEQVIFDRSGYSAREEVTPAEEGAPAEPREAAAGTSEPESGAS